MEKQIKEKKNYDYKEIMKQRTNNKHSEDINKSKLTIKELNAFNSNIKCNSIN